MKFFSASDCTGPLGSFLLCFYFLFVVVSAYFGWVLLFYFLGGGMRRLDVPRGSFVLRDSVSWVASK